MRNNFQLIKPILNFDSPEDFYFLQIIKRRKENPDLSTNMKLIDNIFIYSLSEFDELEPKIIQICSMHNARAYLRINRRNTKQIALQTMRKLSEILISGDYKSAKSAYLSAAGEYHSEPKKRWLIDIDEQDLHLIGEIRSTIENLQKSMPKTGYQIIREIPSSTGIHIITNPFNLNEFKKKFPKIDIHKDNPTLLYIP